MTVLRKRSFETSFELVLVYTPSVHPSMYPSSSMPAVYTVQYATRDMRKVSFWASER